MVCWDGHIIGLDQTLWVNNDGECPCTKTSEAPRFDNGICASATEFLAAVDNFYLEAVIQYHNNAIGVFGEGVDPVIF